MLDYTLSATDLDALRASHRSTREKREADRIKSVVLLAMGWTAEQVAEVRAKRWVRSWRPGAQPASAESAGGERLVEKEKASDWWAST